MQGHFPLLIDTLSDPSGASDTPPYKPSPPLVKVRRAEPLVHQPNVDANIASPVAFALRYLDAVWNHQEVDEATLVGAEMSILQRARNDE